MFTNYQNIPDNYVPDNMSHICSIPKSYTKLDPVSASKPYEEYNARGELVGYSWRYGETLNLEFNIDGEITVESDAIVYSQSGQAPQTYTEGHIDQKAYNVVDLKSWTCLNMHDGIYAWKEDSEFIYDESSTRSVFVSAATYLKDKMIDVVIYNFRREPVHVQTFNGATKVICPITADLSNKLVKGIYYCSLTVYNDTMKLPIFSNEDCVLLVK